MNKTDRHLKTETVDTTYKCGHTKTKRICGYASVSDDMEGQIKDKIRYFQLINCSECYYEELNP